MIGATGDNHSFQKLKRRVYPIKITIKDTNCWRGIKTSFCWYDDVIKFFVTQFQDQLRFLLASHVRLSGQTCLIVTLAMAKKFPVERF